MDATKRHASFKVWAQRPLITQVQGCHNSNELRKKCTPQAQLCWQPRPITRSASRTLCGCHLPDLENKLPQIIIVHSSNSWMDETLTHDYLQRVIGQLSFSAPLTCVELLQVSYPVMNKREVAADESRSGSCSSRLYKVCAASQRQLESKFQKQVWQAARHVDDQRRSRQDGCWQRACSNAGSGLFLDFAEMGILTRRAGKEVLSQLRNFQCHRWTWQWHDFSLRENDFALKNWSTTKQLTHLPQQQKSL